MPTIPYASGGIPITGGMPAYRPDDTVAQDPATKMAAARLMDLKRLGTQWTDAVGAADAAGGTNTDIGTPGVTRLEPSRTSAFSGRDAQSLATLDPRALEEANKIAALDQPKKMTGSFGGKSFEMTPAARVGRNQLAEIYNKYQGVKGQERQDAVRGQEQAGKERIVGIPGEQATKRREMELGTEERLAGKKFESEAPVRAAEIAAKQAQTAATTGAEGRAQAQAARQPSPQQESIDAALAQAQASPFATTPAGRAQIMALYKMSTAGKAMPPDQAGTVAEGVAGPPAGVSDIAADPGIASLIERARGSQTSTIGGFLPGAGERTATATAAKNVAIRAIRAKAAQQGWTPDEVNEYVRSIGL